LNKSKGFFFLRGFGLNQMINSNMLKVGITGNIGSGKSILTKIFSQLGIPIYDADSRAKAVMVEDPILVQGIKKLLGENAYFGDGALNRNFISSQVFKNAELLNGLNSLVHPAVANDFESWVAKQNAPYVLKEAALLIESKSYLGLNQLIVVLADEEIRLKRTMRRDEADEEMVLARMRNQMSQEEKADFAQFIIHNNNDLLIPQVMKIHRQLLALANQ
jgi:dephospho-CoA kinase